MRRQAGWSLPYTAEQKAKNARDAEQKKLRDDMEWESRRILAEHRAPLALMEMQHRADLQRMKSEATVAFENITDQIAHEILKTKHFVAEQVADSWMVARRDTSEAFAQFKAETRAEVAKTKQAVAKSAPKVVESKSVERDRAGRIVAVLEKYTDGSELRKDVVRDANGKLIGVKHSTPGVRRRAQAHVARKADDSVRVWKGSEQHTPLTAADLEAVEQAQATYLTAEDMQQ